MLCDFILEDGDQGAWLFQQIIEDELRQLYNRHLRVSISKTISRQIIPKISVLQVRFKNELVLVLVHFTKKRTFRSFLVLWEKVNLVQFKVHQKMN